MDIAFFVTFLTAIIFGGLALRYCSSSRELRRKLQTNLDVDLELATSEQLMIELRKRPPTYLLLRPENNVEEGCFGLSVEIHNIEAVPAAGILKMAAFLAEKELKKNGIELPDFPDQFG